MIRTKEDLKFYLREDLKQYELSYPWWIGIYFGSELSHAYRIVRSLRRYEYARNNSMELLKK